jgi:hypothetical protein
MIRRLTSPHNLRARCEEPDIIEMVLPGFEPEDWIETSDQFTLTNGYDILMAKRWADNTIEIHWALRNRGRRAIHAGVDFLRYLFHKEGARIVVGTVPAHKRAARWFSRQVGGKSNGIVQTELGPMEFFSLTREDFEAQHEFPNREI